MLATEAQFLESGWASVSKHDEKLCGDYFKTFENRGRQVFVLSDGLGSGVCVFGMHDLATSAAG